MQIDCSDYLSWAVMSKSACLMLFFFLLSVILWTKKDDILFIMHINALYCRRIRRISMCVWFGVVLIDWSSLSLFKHLLKSLIWWPRAANTSQPCSDFWSSVCLYHHTVRSMLFMTKTTILGRARTEEKERWIKASQGSKPGSVRDRESDAANVSYVRVKCQEWKWISSAR